eukprot:TRINITY_DN6017_c0_g1_i2.p1 TRINITY_DN6017_c0_g1~~TRINITY_DN6017_c0_g1_i2.p1  ORF type:complete len:675 (+),score=107.63 TRINITY_DN6017_c0_g1_i2:413-2437(+)
MEKQAKEILKEVAWHEFPQHWETLVEYLLHGLGMAKSRVLAENSGKEVIDTLTPALKLQLQKFLSIYKVVIKQQTKKRRAMERSAFYGVSKAFMAETKALADLFDSALQKMLAVTFTASGIIASNFDQDLITIGHEMDKLMLMLVLCSFNSSELTVRSEQDCIELIVVQKYLDKLNYYLMLIKQICNCSTPDQYIANFLQSTFKLFCTFVKQILNKMSEIQMFDPLIMCNSLDRYLGITMEFLSMSMQPIFPENLQHISLLCIYSVLGTNAYTKIEGAPVKSRSLTNTPHNFDSFTLKAKAAFKAFFTPPIVTGLFNLIVTKLLPLKSLSLWTSDPEAFIEQEDEALFACNARADKEVPASYVAYKSVEQLLLKFPEVCAEQAKSYINNLVEGKLQGDVLLQDAIYNTIEMLPKAYGMGGVEVIRPESFLGLLEQQIGSAGASIQGHLLKRRYIILVTKWLEFINKDRILGYLGNIVRIMCETDQLILKYHCCMGLRKILSFLEGESLNKRRYNRIRSATPGEPLLEELKKIEAQINYSELLSSSIKVIVDVLDSFTSPTLVWTLINFLTLLLEKCEHHSSEKVLEVLECSRFAGLFANRDELVQQALMDMSQALVFSFPSSAQIAKLCFHIVSTQLAVAFHPTIEKPCSDCEFESVAVHIEEDEYKCREYDVV